MHWHWFADTSGWKCIR